MEWNDGIAVRIDQLITSNTQTGTEHPHSFNQFQYSFHNNHSKGIKLSHGQTGKTEMHIDYDSN